MVDIMDICKSLNISIGTLIKNPEKAILENGRILKPVPDCYKNKEICNKAVDNYPHALEFAPGCYKTQRM